jgi:hypothetical protein
MLSLLLLKTNLKQTIITNSYWSEGRGAGRGLVEGRDKN